MSVQVAGPAGGLCDEAGLLIEKVVAEHGIEINFKRITEFDEIIALGVYAVPGIIVDGVLKSVGRVPEQDEIIRWLTERER